MMKFSHSKLALGATCLALLLSSCVAQEHHEDVKTQAKHWQKAFIEADSQRAELAAENTRLKAMLRASEQNPVSASASLEDIDRRLDQLKKLGELGAQEGDVMKFAVDGGNLYRVKDAILFPLGSATLSPEGQQALEGIVADIQKQPHGQISVRGHTDNVPVSKPETKAKFPHGNLELSAARAVEVGAALQSILGPGNDLVVMGYGESQPVAPNDSADNRQKNRRVEIFVADAQAPQK